MLAVDVSGSVSSAEYDFQRLGYAAAFRDSTLQSAIFGKGGIAATLVYWSGQSEQQQTVGWTLINDVASANAFANLIEAAPRPFNGSTAIGSAIDFSAALLAQDNGYEGLRQVIDISGDGTNNDGPGPTGPRDNAVAAGITINGLPILSEVTWLDIYFQFLVIGGTDAFVETAADYSVFQPALLSKLTREIDDSPSAVPEPETYLLIGTGLLGLGAGWRRRRRAGLP